MRFVSLLAVCCISSFTLAAAPLPKLREGRPSTRPAEVPKVTKVTTADVKLVLKSGAPPAVQQWYNDLPALRERRIAELQVMIDLELQRAEAAGSAEMQELDEKIALAQAELRSLAQVKGKVVEDGIGPSGRPNYRVDKSPVTNANLQSNRIRRALGEMKRKQKEGLGGQASPTVVSLQARQQLMRDNPLYIDMPTLSPIALEVGDYGHFNVSVRVVQVVDKSNLIAEIEELNVRTGADNDTRMIRRDRTVWITGFDTENIVDDDILYSPLPLAITGTKEYESGLGKRKVLKMEPLNVKDWVEVQPQRSMPVVPSIYIGGGVA